MSERAQSINFPSEGKFPVTNALPFWSSVFLPLHFL
jgi:hypothetical protein